MWCERVNSYLIGPYLFDRNIDRHTYLELLRDYLPGLLENVNLATRQRMWLQQDGAPPHFALIVREFLNSNFNERWIGRVGPFEWPPCLPDLNSPDFFLWGYIKNVVKTVLKDVYVCVFKPMESTSNSYSMADCNTGSNGERQRDSC